MDASWTLWVIIGVVVALLLAGAMLAGRRASAGNVPSPDKGDGMAHKRPGLPGEPD